MKKHLIFLSASVSFLSQSDVFCFLFYRLQTYSVICLNETCGLLEWVENTTGFRILVGNMNRLYYEFGRTNYCMEGMRNATTTLMEFHNQLLTNAPNPAANHMQLLQLYRTAVLPKCIPRFHVWFLKRFPDPTTWFEARLLFTRSAAIWSAVGHIVGLGDRHGENILINQACIPSYDGIRRLSVTLSFFPSEINRLPANAYMSILTVYSIKGSVSNSLKWCHFASQIIWRMEWE